MPVLVPLAPARSLAERFPEHLKAVLNALGADPLRQVARERPATFDNSRRITMRPAGVGTQP